MINESEWEKFLNDKFSEIPEDFLQKCLDVLPEFISDYDKTEILRLYNLDPLHWIGDQHHFWGMSLRNFLREKGLTDNYLPDGNWDDYAYQVVERYIGVR